MAGFLDEGGDTDSVATEAERLVESMFVEPPVVTRALMRSRKKRGGGSDINGPPGFGRTASSDIQRASLPDLHRAGTSSHLENGTANLPSRGPEDLKRSTSHTSLQKDSEEFAKGIMVNVQAAQRASHVVMTNLPFVAGMSFSSMQCLRVSCLTPGFTPAPPLFPL